MKRSKSSAFYCKRCKKLVHHIQTKANKKELCSKKCDGIPRDGGGYPLDESLRTKYKWAITLKNRANRVLRNLTSSDPFYQSDSWRKLRYNVIVKFGRKCMACGIEADRVHVDHIKPRSRFPELELDINNLQILCETCNLGKGAWDQTDWRNS